MDVVCERCKTEYEFDDALVSERGTTVKCTNCGHQFKIYRPSSDSDAARVWNLRRPDGTVIPFDSLAVLQKWILEGRVSKMDEISRTGEPWKSLGAIAELESFFATAELRAPQGSPLRGVSRPSSGAPPGRSVPPASQVTAPRGAAPRAPAPMALSSGTLRPGFGQGVTPGPGPGGPTTSQSTSVGVPPIPALPAVPPPPRLPTPIRGSSVRPPVAPPNGSVQIPPPPRMPHEMGLAPAPPPPPPPLPATSSAPILGAPVSSAGGADAYSLGAAGSGVQADRFSLGEIARARPQAPVEAPTWSKAAIGPPPVDRGHSLPMPTELAVPSLPPPPRDMPPPTSPLPDDDERETVAPRRSNVSGLVIGLTLGLVAAGGVTLGAWRAGLLEGAGATVAPLRPPPPHVASPPSPAAPLVAHALGVARVRTAQAYEDAREELTRAIALDGSYGRAMAARAEVQAAWSEMLKQDADDLDARAAVAGRDAATASAQAVLLRRESEDRADRARSDQQVAERGLDAAPPADRAETEAMLGDVARVLGDRAGAQRHIDAVRHAQGLSPEAEMYALLFDRDAGAIGQAVPGLRAVIARAGDLDRARVTLARLLVNEGDAEGARAQLDAVITAHPGHDDVALMLQALTRNEAPMHTTGTTVAAVTPATPDVPTVVAPPVPVVPTPSQPSTVVAPTPPTHTASVNNGGESGGGSYEDLVEDGERLQNDGRTSQAREKFTRALAQRPSGCEALTGLGYVALDGHDVSGAISRFRQALASNARYSDAFIGLGEAYSSQGSYQQALTAYNQYLEINPSGSHASMARRQVESLQDRLQNTPRPASTGGSQGGTDTPTGPAPTGGSGTVTDHGSTGSHTTESPAPTGDGTGP